jgi:hypothetical protein
MECAKNGNLAKGYSNEGNLNTKPNLVFHKDPDCLKLLQNNFDSSHHAIIFATAKIPAP